MRIQDVLAEFGKQAGLPLGLDRNGTCRIVFGDTTTVDVEAPADRPDRVFLYSAVGLLPAGNRTPLLEDLLGANLFGRGTADATLAIDAEAGEILLQRILDMDRIDTRAFTAILESFVQAAMTWSQALRRAHHHGGSEPAILDPSSMIRA